MSKQAASAAGLVIVDKAGGLTSHDVVARVRRLAGTRKVGHAGTLDPMATGVLVLGVNRATRLLGHLMLTEKGYDATIRLGVATVTDDAEGQEVSRTEAVHLTDEQIHAGLEQFRGDIDQVPTKVSAIKVAGKRSYQRVRDGEEVELKARRVTISELTVTQISRDLAAHTVDVTVTVRCSSGTYIRAIARDLGAVLGVGGHLTALRRTAVGPFTLSDSVTLEALAEEFCLTPIAEAARATFAAVEVTAEQAGHVRCGRPLSLGLSQESAIFDDEGEFLALYGPATDEGVSKPIAVFVEPKPQSTPADRSAGPAQR